MSEIKAFSHVVQHAEIISNHLNRIRLIGSVPGAVGFTYDGTMFEYSPESHRNHIMADETIVNLNHHEDEVIGRIINSFADSENRLIMEIEIAPEYSFFVPIILQQLNDGHSIESLIIDAEEIAPGHMLVNKYVLTGIAVLFTKPPACDTEFCHVLSSKPDVSAKENLELLEIARVLSEMDEEQLSTSYDNLLGEQKTRELVKKLNVPSTTIGDTNV